jgi:hypothetical protein
VHISPFSPAPYHFYVLRRFRWTFIWNSKKKVGHLYSLLTQIAFPNRLRFDNGTFMAQTSVGNMSVGCKWRDLSNNAICRPGAGGARKSAGALASAIHFLRRWLFSCAGRENREWKNLLPSSALVISKAIVRRDLKKRSEWKRFPGRAREATFQDFHWWRSCKFLTAK